MKVLVYLFQNAFVMKVARVLLLLVLMSSAYSEEATEVFETLSLVDAIDKTLDQNPTLKAFRFHDVALEGQRDSAKYGPGYSLDFAAENLLGSGNYSDADSAEFTVSLSSVLELGGKRRAREEVVNSQVARHIAHQQVESLDLLGEVTRRYVDVLAAQEQVKLAEDAVALSSKAMQEGARRVEAGAAPGAELKRAKAEKAQAMLQLSAKERQLAYFKMALAEMWQGSADDFASVNGSLYRFGSDISFETLYERLQQNPAIEVFAGEERLQSARIRLAESQSKLDVDWSVGVRQFQETDDTALVAEFSVPLFSGKRNKGSLIAASAARDELVLQKQAALSQMRIRLYQAYQNRQQAITTVSALQSNIVPELKEALKETQQAYQRGRYSYLDYVSARQALLSARRDMIEAAKLALYSGAEIEQLTSEPLPDNYHVSIK